MFQAAFISFDSLIPDLGSPGLESGGWGRYPDREDLPCLLEGPQYLTVKDTWL